MPTFFVQLHRRAEIQLAKVIQSEAKNSAHFDKIFIEITKNGLKLRGLDFEGIRNQKYSKKHGNTLFHQNR